MAKNQTTPSQSLALNQDDTDSLSEGNQDNQVNQTNSTNFSLDFDNPSNTAQDFEIFDDEGNSNVQNRMTDQEDFTTIQAPEGSSLQEVAEGTDVPATRLGALNENITADDTFDSDQEITVPTTLKDRESALTATTPTEQKQSETNVSDISADELSTDTSIEDLVQQASEDAGFNLADREDVDQTTTDAEAFVRSLQTTAGTQRESGLFESAQDFADEPVEQGEERQRQLLTEFADLKGEFEEKPDRVKELRQQFGFQDNVEKLQDIRTQRERLKNEFDQLITEAEGRPVASSLVTGRKQQLRNQKASEVGALASVEQALTDNINTARRAAKKTAELEFEPVKKKIDAVEKAIELNKDNLSRDETKRAERLSFILNERKRLIDKKEKEREDVINFAGEMARKGAGSDVVQNILDSDTLEKGVQEASPFLKKVKDIKRVQSFEETFGGEGVTGGSTAEQDSNLDETLSVNEAEKLGVPFGTTKREAMKMGKTPGDNEQKTEEGAEQAKTVKKLAKDLLNDPNFSDFVGPASSLDFGDPIASLTGEKRLFRKKAEQLVNNLTLEKLDKIAGAISESELALAKKAGTFLASDKKNQTVDLKLPENAVKEVLQELAGIEPKEGNEGGGSSGVIEGFEDFNEELSTSKKGSKKVAESIAQVESGGNYNAIGPETRNGNRAYGKYQVMDFNIPNWTKEVLGEEMTPREFLNDPEAQDKVAQAKIDELMEKHGNPADVASVWFSGRPLDQARQSQDVTGTTVPNYVKNVLNNLA